jgi:hypothetical protein
MSHYLALADNTVDGKKCYTECPSTFEPAAGAVMGAFLAAPVSEVVASAVQGRGKKLPTLGKVAVYAGSILVGYFAGRMYK